MSETVIKVENLTKFYQLGLINHGTLAKDLQGWWAKIRGKEDPNSQISLTNSQNNDQNTDFIYALKDVSFDVQQGEVLGIIGANGAGKSTLLKILSRVTSPTSGCIKIKGRIGSLLEVGTGFHPELTGRENIYLNGAIIGMRRWEIDKKLDEIIDFSGVEKFIDTPVKRYSSGMYVRLAFAVAAHLDPEILVVDEVLAVGDADFQKKCLGKMGDVSKKEGRTVLFVSHNMAAVRQLCTRGILLEKGGIKFSGAIEDVVEHYISLSDADLSVRKRTWEINESLPACITGIEIMVDGKTPDKMIDMTDKIKIGLDYYVKEDIKHASVTFSLLKDGVCLFMTWDTDIKPELLGKRAKGYHRTEFYLPNSFKPGIYDTKITFGIANQGSIDRKESPLQFEINNVMTEGSRMSFTRPGLVRFDIPWNEVG